jgi:hypothetical protein
MNQPYPYWLLETAVSWIIGFATNDINGGQPDDPMETKNLQYQWLVGTWKKNKGRVRGPYHPPCHWGNIG